MNKTKRCITTAICLVLTLTALSPFALSKAYAASSFENSIANFPESYKPYLRTLHSKYPSWQFEAVKTGIDWYNAVGAEYSADKSLVTSDSSYTDIYKSREKDDYNASTNTYIQKDAGFVKANKLAISYYMDPRNFLCERGIFQFEKLSFDSSTTVEDVEAVLKNTFMENAYISYYGGTIKKTTDSSGKTTYTYTVKDKKITTDEKYSQVIYDAGKKYNVSPCFLASKIINEVGRNGSNSVSGQQATYPGVYNFYNVGAYDGGNPIEKGLKWASNNATYAPGTYERPWVTPMKSISGGAQFNAETYISAGQYTLYFQKFNVSPTSKYNTYSHQYMTNLAGAAGPAESTYLAYKSSGSLDGKFIFAIPVFENMPASTSTAGKIELADGLNQLATVKSASNVRSGPSTSYSTLAAKTVSKSTVNVIESVATDDTVHNSIIKYPYWTKIKYTNNSKSYTGYVYSNFLEPLTTTAVEMGDYVPLSFKTSSALSYNYISSEPDIARVFTQGTINTTCNIRKGAGTAYSKYDFQISKGSSVKILEAVTTISAVYPIWYKVEFEYANDIYNGYICSDYVTKEKEAIDFLKEGTVIITAYDSIGNYQTVKYSVSNSASEREVKNVKVSSITDTAATVSYSKNNSCNKYEIVLTNSNGKKIKTLTTTATSVKLSDLDVGTKYNVYVRAFDSDSNLYGTFSQAKSFKTTDSGKIDTVGGLKAQMLSYTTVKLSWNKVSGADGYRIYTYNSSTKKYTLLKEVGADVTIYNDISKNSIKNTNYSITAFRKTDKGEIVSAYSPICAYTPQTIKPNKVTNLTKKSETSSSVSLSWTAVDGASGYEIYKYDTSSKSYKLVKATTKTSYKVTGLSSVTAYKFKVRAYITVYSKNFNGSCSSVLTAYTDPAQVSNIKQSSTNTISYTLKWSSVKGADGYRVSYYDTKSKKYKTLKDVTSTSLKITNKSPGQATKYIIKAYNIVSDKRYYSSSYTVFEATTAPKPVGKIKVSNKTSSSYKLSWSKAEGADKYVVYKLNTSTNKYEKLTTTTKNSVTLKKLKANKTSTYMIKAVSVSDNYTAYSSASSAVKAKTLKK